MKKKKPAAAQPTISELPWFRLVINKDGSIATCENFVGARDDRGRHVHFIQALNAEDAIQKWAAVYDREATLRKINNAKNHAARMSQRKPGFCICGKPVRAGFTTTGPTAGSRHSKCLRCYKSTQRTGAKKISVSTPEQKAAALLARRARIRARSHTSGERMRSKLKQVLEAFNTMPPARFRGWLVAQIQEQQDKIDAKRAKAGLAPQQSAQAESNTARVIAATLAQPRKHGNLRVGQQ